MKMLRSKRERGGGGEERERFTIHFFTLAPLSVCRGEEEADGGEDSPGEGQGGHHQQTDTGHEAKAQGN